MYFTTTWTILKNQRKNKLTMTKATDLKVVGSDAALAGLPDGISEEQF
jgi:hypothetical protein